MQQSPGGSIAVRADRAAFFVSDSTGITAETLGNALLANFPGVTFARRTISFVDSPRDAVNVVYLNGWYRSIPLRRVVSVPDGLRVNASC